MLTHNNSIDVNFLRTINTKSDQNFYCPTDLVLSLQHFNWKSLYDTLHKGLCEDFLWSLDGQILAHKDSNVIDFQSNFTQNMAKTSFWQFHSSRQGT